MLRLLIYNVLWIDISIWWNGIYLSIWYVIKLIFSCWHLPNVIHNKYRSINFQSPLLVVIEYTWSTIYVCDVCDHTIKCPLMWFAKKVTRKKITRHEMGKNIQKNWKWTLFSRNKCSVSQISWWWWCSFWYFFRRFAISIKINQSI